MVNVQRSSFDTSLNGNKELTSRQTIRYCIMLERRPCSRSELYMNTRNLELRDSGVLVQDGLPGIPLFNIALMLIEF